MFKTLIPSILVISTSVYGCASTMVYKTNPEDDCIAKFQLVENKKPNYFNLPMGALEESCLNGKDREVIFKVSNKQYRLLIDPTFNDPSRDARRLNDFLLQVPAGTNFGFECGYLRRLLDGEIDGITLTER